MCQNKLPKKALSALNGQSDFRIPYLCGVKKNHDEFYEKWSLTFEGTTIDDSNLNWLINWFKEHNCNMIKEDFYVIKGRMMNDYYHLTGDNAYPDNINILVIKLEDLENPDGIYRPRFEIGGRFFNDICDNNARRERQLLY